MANIFDLQGGFTDKSELGNKGANLVTMTGLGLPVPPGFVVSIETYREWRETGQLPEVAINESLAALEKNMGRKFGEGLEVSVRSSAPVSMPGMMDTILNLGNINEIRSAIKRIFESWDSLRAVEYRRLNKIPPTLGTAALSLGMAVFSGRGRALCMGVALYLGYVVFIGGDFMSGRLFSGVLLIGAALVVRCDFSRARLPAAAALAVALLATPHTPLRAAVDYGRGRSDLTDARGVADERGHYYPATGLFARGRRPLADHRLAAAGRRARARGVTLIAAGNIGLFGYYAGPEVHVLDGFALGDPLLARLPIRSIQWRIGHFVRAIPDGYRETLASGRNQIADARIRAYYQILRQIVRDPLLSLERLRLVWRLNTGHYDGLVEPLYRSRSLQERGFDLLAAGAPDRALPVFAQAVALDSARAAAWYGLARTQRLLGRDEAALEPALRAFTREPQMPAFAEELVELAAAFGERGAHDTARSLYRAYLREHPDDTRVADRLRAVGAP